MSEKAKKSSRNHFLLVLLAVFAAVLTLQMGAGEVKAAAKGFRTVKGKTYYIDDSGKKHKKLTKKEKDKIIRQLEKSMREAARKLEFEEAARLRDVIMELRAGN